MSFKQKYCKIVLFAFMISCSCFINAQFIFDYYDSIKVIKGLDTIQQPWTGGINHTQVSTIDFDFDGEEDLFLFDRSSNKVTLFMKEFNGLDNYYKLELNAQSKFPNDLKYRVKLVDFNNDGKKDVFTYGFGGIKVYKNTGNPTDGLQWSLFKDPVSFDNGGILSSIYVSSDEIPAYVDVDNDGDIDILTFHSSIARVEWYKNLSIENYGNADSLDFVLQEACWGDFVESGSGNLIDLDSQQTPCGSTNKSGIHKSNRTLRHAAGTILALDMNDSGLKDAVIGDVGYNTLTLLINDGGPPSQNAFMISQDQNFPSNTTPVDISTFPAAFYEDVDHDGVKDLLVGTNANGASDNTESLWFYKNLGTNDNPNFSFVQKAFLQYEMIENGKASKPILVDVNNDGIQDLLVSNYFNYNDSGPNQTKTQYFINAGTNENPIFRLILSNWENFANNGLGLNASPTFGDLDDDGDLDMVVGYQSGELYFYENTGGTGSMNFSLLPTQLTDFNGDDIQVSGSASPQLFDLNNDNLLDLVIGQSQEGIHYYENTGVPNNYQFDLVTENLGNVQLTTPNYIQATSTPNFIRKNDTTFLFVGNRSGTVHLYDEIDGNIQDGDNFNLVSDNYLGIDVGEFSAPFVSRLGSSEDFLFLLGGDLGGLLAFKTTDSSSLSLNEESKPKSSVSIKIYPNPSENGVFNLNVENSNEKLIYEVFEITGRKIIEKSEFSNNTIINISNSSKGIYVLLVWNKDHSIVSSNKLIVN
jgi:hypothetical protein